MADPTKDPVAELVEATTALLKSDGRHVGGCDPECPKAAVHGRVRAAIRAVKEAK